MRRSIPLLCTSIFAQFGFPPMKKSRFCLVIARKKLQFMTKNWQLRVSGGFIQEHLFRNFGVFRKEVCFFNNKIISTWSRRGNWRNTNGRLFVCRISHFQAKKIIIFSVVTRQSGYFFYLRKFELCKDVGARTGGGRVLAADDVLFHFLA